VAYDWNIKANVSVIEPTYMPATVAFKITETGGSCAAGTCLTWKGKGDTEQQQYENSKSVLGVLTAALVSGNIVYVFGNNDDCSVDYIHLNSSN
jgi:hypothetical protein